MTRKRKRAKPAASEGNAGAESSAAVGNWRFKWSNGATLDQPAETEEAARAAAWQYRHEEPESCKRI